MTKLVNKIRQLDLAVRGSVPWGQYIPGNKLIAGALAAGVVAGLKALGVADLSGTATAEIGLGAFAAVNYLLPESPMAAAHALTRNAKGPVTVQQVPSAPKLRVQISQGAPEGS